MDYWQYTRAKKNNKPMIAEHFENRKFDCFLLLQNAFHVIRFFELEANDHANDDQQR
ncbi:hypothetical protein D9M68_774590 [compost metagenome]